MLRQQENPLENREDLLKSHISEKNLQGHRY